MKTLEERQLQAMARVIKYFATRIGEDTMGAFIYTGGFNFLSDEEIISLSDKIDNTDDTSK